MRRRTAPVPGRLRARGAALALLCAVLVSCSDGDAPPAFDVTTASIADVHAALADGRTSCRAIARQVVARIAATDDDGPALNAVIEVNPDLDRDAAGLDRAFAAGGPVGPLHCVPVAVKDNYDTGDRMRTTAGSLTMGDSVTPADAFSIARLRAVGALLVAKVNMDEFAFGVAGYSSRGGQTLDAYRRTRIPGGSSGGSAVAVAAGMAVLGTGTDTAGSIRIPAAFNSLVGIKPTLGLVGRTGIVPASRFLDVAGPLARNVRDAAIALGALTGVDPGDPDTQRSIGRSSDDYTPYLDADGLDGARLAVLRRTFGADLFAQNAEVDAAFATALDAIGARGATLIDPVIVANVLTEDELLEILITLANDQFAGEIGAYLATQAPLAAVHDAREIATAARSLGPDVVKNLNNLVNACDAAPATEQQLERALALRARLADAVSAALDEAGVDALVFPTFLCPPSPLPGVVDPTYVCASAPPMPFPFGVTYGGDPILMASIAGLPEITVPAGYTTDGAPIGISFLGRAFSEGTLLRLAYAYEQATLLRRPPDFATLP
jgi:amidase